MDSCTTSARRRGIRRRLGSGGGVALCVLALAACSSVPDEINPVSWYDSIAGDDEVAEAEPAPGAEEEFPTLSSVPDEPAQTQGADDYAAVAEGLQADKANAQYTNETIRRADDEVEGSLPVPEPTVAAAEPEAEPEFVQPEPEPVAAETVVEPEPAVVPETTADSTAAAQATQPAQATQGKDYSQYATVAEGLRAKGANAPLPAASPVAATTTATSTTVAATTTATTTAATTTATAATTTAQVQPVEQAVQPVPAQPLQPAQQATVVAQPVPAQPLPGTTVAAATTTAQVAVPAATTTATTATAAAPAAAQGSFMDMFNAAYQASAARTLPGSAATAAVVPAVAQPTAATVLPASYAPTARYHGARPTRLIASVLFADGSARLDAQARKTLLDVAYAYGATGGQILLVGHASGSGGSNAELANFDVSLKRAVAVANELMRLQVTPENILVEAVGDNMPQVSLDMAGGAVNRRVDIYLGN